MTLVSDIIRDAYRESNLIAIGTEPSGAQNDEALRLLNRFVASVYGNEAGERLQPLVIGRNNIEKPSGYPWYNTTPFEGDWCIPQDARLILNLEEALTVYLDPNPQDGQRFAVQDKSGNLSTYNLTIEGNGRTITGDNSLVLDEDNSNTQYIYEQNSGDWRLISPLVETDTFPFASEFEDFFVIGLTLRLNPRNDVQIDGQSMESFKRYYRQFAARYSQTVETPSELALALLTGGYNLCYSDTRLSNSAFNSGNMYGRFRW